VGKCGRGRTSGRTFSSKNVRYDIPDPKRDKKKGANTWKQKYDMIQRFQTLWAAKLPWQPITVLEQIQGYSTMESRRKKVQLSTLFSILCDGRPMPEYVACAKLYEFFNVPDHPTMHWSIGSGWLMPNHIWDFVKKRMIEMIKATNFIAITADETSANDNTSWVVIHVYIMQNWSRMSLLCSLQKMTSELIC
jgi:hypothetical protein